MDSKKGLIGSKSLTTNASTTIPDSGTYTPPGSLEDQRSGGHVSNASGEQTESQSASMFLYLAVLCSLVSPFLFGYTIGYTSPSQNTMEGDDKSGVLPPSGLVVLTSSQFSLYASLLNVGAAAGALSGSFLSDRFGRKKTLVLTAIPHIIGWLGSAFASNPYLLIVLRIFIGWGVGVGSAVVPCYIGEVATTGLRGALGACNQLAVTFGIFFANFAGTYVFLVDENSQEFVQWRHVCLLAGVLAFVLFIILLLPESPKWLASQGKAEDAKTALRRLRNGDSSMEAQAILDEVSQQTDSGIPGTATASLGTYKKSLIIGVGLCVFQQLSGVNAVMMYTADICKDAGMTNSNQAAMMVMGLQVVLTGVACVLMERAGRRALLLFGSSCMTLAHVMLSYYFLTLDHEGMWGPSWLAIAGLGIFVLGFSLALGPIPWLILAELFPTEVRSLACSIACMVNWSCSFIVTLAFLPLENAISKEGTFLVFAVVTGLCFVFVLTLVPETKGKTVEEVIASMSAMPRRSSSYGARNMSLQAPDERQVVAVQ